MKTLILNIATLATLAGVMPQALAEDNIHATPLAVFAETFATVAPRFERSKIQTTWAGFYLRAGNQQDFDKSEFEPPSPNGFWLGVRCLPAQDLKAATEAGPPTAYTEKKIGMELPKNEGEDSGLVITLRYGFECDGDVVAKLFKAIEAIKKQAIPVDVGRPVANPAAKPFVKDQDPIVERLKPDPLLGDMQYTYNLPSGVFTFRVSRPHRPNPDLFVMIDGKPNENGKYGNMQDFAKSLDSMMQIIKGNHEHLEYFSVNLAHIDQAASRIREAASNSSEWKHRKPLKDPDVASYGKLVGEIILQKHVLSEIEAVLLKYQLKMSGIGMENLGLTQSSIEGEDLPELLSCAEIAIVPLDDKDANK